jgi:hypothetical protein
MGSEVIALDIDDVAVKHVEGFVEWSNKTYGTNLTINDYSEAWEELWGIAKEDVEPRKKLFFTDEIVGNFEIIEGAPDGIQKLGAKKKLIGVTSRREGLKDVTEMVLDSIAPRAVSNVVFCTYFKNGEKYTRSKSEVCTGIGAQTLVDDQLKHCLSVGKVGIQAVLFGAYPWNETATELPSTISRARDWPEVLDHFGIPNS